MCEYVVYSVVQLHFKGFLVPNHTLDNSRCVGDYTVPCHHHCYTVASLVDYFLL
jgi:hypothetical protein